MGVSDQGRNQCRSKVREEERGLRGTPWRNRRMPRSLFGTVEDGIPELAQQGGETLRGVGIEADQMLSRSPRLCS